MSIIRRSISSLFAALTGKQQIKHKDRARKKARNFNPVNRHERLDDAIDDIPTLNQGYLANSGVIFGAYGPDEWVTSSYVRSCVENNTSTLITEGTWITDANWQVSDWILSISKRFNFISMSRALVFMPWGIIEVNNSRGKLILELNGEPKEVMSFIKKLDRKLKRAENLIEWVYSTRGESISVPLNYKAAIPNAYPWLPKKLEDYIDDYLNSNASVLILIGPPGTGKTTFIKNLIHRSGGDAKVTYDEKVMNDDSLFAGFIESSTKFLVMEDADTFLAKREDGNTMMHKFLNVSDGLISAKDKKLVFSTNLPSVKDIDSALMRPGRCFDVVEFRTLARNEALAITNELGLTLPDGNEFTLAELFNVQPSGEAKSIGRKVGF